MPLIRRPSRDEELRKVYLENVSAVYAFLAYSVSARRGGGPHVGDVRARAARMAQLRPLALQRRGVGAGHRPPSPHRPLPPPAPPRRGPRSTSTRASSRRSPAPATRSSASSRRSGQELARRAQPARARGARPALRRGPARRRRSPDAGPQRGQRAPDHFAGAAPAQGAPARAPRAHGQRLTVRVWRTLRSSTRSCPSSPRISVGWSTTRGSSTVWQPCAETGSPPPRCSGERPSRLRTSTTVPKCGGRGAGSEHRVPLPSRPRARPCGSRCPEQGRLELLDELRRRLGPRGDEAPLELLGPDPIAQLAVRLRSGEPDCPGTNFGPVRMRQRSTARRRLSRASPASAAAGRARARWRRRP